MQTYSADPAKFVKAFPEAIAEPPPLLREFANWLSDKPWGSVGGFALTPGWSDHILYAGERFHDRFALFIRMPDGSLAGYWLKDARSIDGAPIVMLGSEGQYETLAPDLPHLLARLATADFDDSGVASDFLPNEFQDVPNLRPALASWVSERLGMGGVSRLKGWRPAGADAFDVWAQAAVREGEAENARDPHVLAISEALKPYRPALGSQPWETNRAHIAWAGDHIEIVDASHGHKPVAERDALIPHLAALRDGAAKRLPGVGLWFSAWITIPAEGPVEIMKEYHYEPKFFLGRPPDAAFRADQARAPRSPRRIPDWLARLLES